MQKNKIEWLNGGYTINPVKGLCPTNCKTPDGYEYCYARAMYKRFRWNPEIRFDGRFVDHLAEIKKPSRIFVGSTMELFGDWIKESWLKMIFYCCTLCPQHTFIFLTKQPQNLRRWSPFPSNCHVGASVTTTEMYNNAMNYLCYIEAKVKFLSFEPLLEWHTEPHLLLGDFEELNWIILGGMSGRKKFYPPEKWIQDIEKAADSAGIPVFEKNNLRKYFLVAPRREMP